MCARVKSLQSCLTLCDPMACSLPGSSVHGILQERIYWSGLPCPPPRGLPNPGIELASPVTTKLQSNSLPLSHWGSPFCISVCVCVSCSVIPDSLQPHGLQPTTFLCPWDFPGKDTGVVCHFLLYLLCLVSSIFLFSLRVFMLILFP